MRTLFLFQFPCACVIRTATLAEGKAKTHRPFHSCLRIARGCALPLAKGGSFSFDFDLEVGEDLIVMEQEPGIDSLPIDLLAYIFVLFTSFADLAQASRVCKKWKQGVKESLARRQSLSFAGWKMDDDSTARLVCHAYNLRKLDIPRSRWSCQITDSGLLRISFAKCISNLTSLSLWGLTGITDEGVVKVVSRTRSLKHLNVGGTFITDESLFAIAICCPNLETIVLWSCRHVTENGLLALADKCLKLKSMNVWGTRVPVDCLNNLLTVNPALKIKA